MTSTICSFYDSWNKGNECRRQPNFEWMPAATAIESSSLPRKLSPSCEPAFLEWTNVSLLLEVNAGVVMAAGEHASPASNRLITRLLNSFAA